MKVEIQLDPSLDEPVVILRAPGPRPEVEALAARLREVTIPKPFTVYREREAVRAVPLPASRFPAAVSGTGT
ncbi:MAG: hypothetical protein K2M15_08205, partial [Oscillospiraceae bacterium]|nr:hypothetical protein [Oscillospiraceae bacterium]